MHSPTPASNLMNIFNGSGPSSPVLEIKPKRNKTVSTSPTGRALPIPIPIGKIKNELSPTSSPQSSYLKSVSLGPAPTGRASLASSLPNPSYFPGYNGSNKLSKTKISGSPKLFVDFTSSYSEDFISVRNSEPIPMTSKSIPTLEEIAEERSSGY